MSPEEDWFKESHLYWQSQDASLNGMLGGYGYLNQPDVKDSKRFLKVHLPEHLPKQLVLDVGAGIGRVSKNVLISFFNQVDILEADLRFVEQAKLTLGNNLRRSFPMRLQDYKCSEGAIYDTIWIQWVLMYASDDDLIKFLEECKKSLKPGGLIGVKENIITTSSTTYEDAADHSIVRTPECFRSLFEKANLELIGEDPQTKFPSSLYPVQMFMLRPRTL